MQLMNVNRSTQRVRAAALLTALLAGAAHAQSSCSSDGQARPTALLERFINADCETCWASRQTPEPASGALAVDWIVPGSRGEDAPLGAVATRDARERLRASGQDTPPQSASVFSRLMDAHRLRVAHGSPFNDYIGTSIELTARGPGPWRAWLLLVEDLPAGVEGSPVARSLVRNALRLEWPASAKRLRESRPMRIPEGAQSERLRVIGWVEDGRGRLVAAAKSACAAQ
jgi:hypothetical protein